MELTTLNYNGLYPHHNQLSDLFIKQSTENTSISCNQAKTIKGNMNFKISNTRLRPHSSTSTNHYHEIRCENLPQQSLLNESRDELQPKSWKPLEGMVKSSVNYVPLSPISFLERAAEVYTYRTSIVYGAFKYTWKETHRRCLKLASALYNDLGVSRGNVVAILAPNVPAMLELHFAIPMVGAIICPLNTLLDPNMLKTLLQHSEAKVLFVDYQLLETAMEAINILKNTNSKCPLLVIISEPNYQSPSLHNHKHDYESLVEGGSLDGFSIVRPNDECDPISLNYTSGTTSQPKGVVYSHRGAYLNSISVVFIHGMRDMATYLWTLPMFHCNGWCFTWGVAAVGGTNICIRHRDPKDLFDNIIIHKVTHMCGAPTILNMMADYLSNGKKLPRTVEIMTGGAPPPPTILLKMEELGFHVSHIYGLTETFGPGTWCLFKSEWELLPLEERAKLKARQGVKHFAMEEVDVRNPVTMESVEYDGKSIGEVMFRGNTIMSGYYKDFRATEEAFAGGWFRTGDLAVKHLDRYIEVKDRSKDIVISGGENINTIEVETVIYSHPAVLEVAVVARPDNYWGQTPCAFVKLKDGFHIDDLDIIQYCRDRMPHYMAPRTVIFDALPRNSTGKVQKFVLRERANNLGSLS